MAGPAGLDATALQCRAMPYHIELFRTKDVSCDYEFRRGGGGGGGRPPPVYLSTYARRSPTTYIHVFKKRQRRSVTEMHL